MNLTRRQALVSWAASLAALPAFSRSLTGAWLTSANGDEAAFLRAVVAGEASVTKKMLAADVGLARARNAEGRSALVLARLGGHVEIVAQIRGTGLDLDVVEAVVVEDWPRVEALMKAHPELCRATHPIGGTPLYAGALAGCGELYRLRSLGCEPDAAPDGGSGYTPARAAMDSRLVSDARRSATDLLGNGSDVNAAQRDGNSVLHGAVRRRSEALLRLAVRKGASVEGRDAAGRTPQDLATEIGWEPGAALLARHEDIPRDCRLSRFAFDRERRPVERPDLSDVPLAEQSQVTAASHFKLDYVKTVLQGDPRLTFSISTDDELAIEACAHVGNHAIMRLHLAAGAPFSLPTAVSLGDAEHIKFLLEAEPRLIHERGAHDFPLMWYAAIGHGSVEIAELLLGYGVSVDQESLGTTALHQCVSRERKDLARWLIEKGADLEPLGYKSDRHGLTPLGLARSMEKSGMVKLLEAAGARV